MLKTTWGTVVLIIVIFILCVVLVVVASVAGNVHCESGINGHLGNAFDTS